MFSALVSERTGSSTPVSNRFEKIISLRVLFRNTSLESLLFPLIKNSGTRKLFLTFFLILKPPLHFYSALVITKIFPTAAVTAVNFFNKSHLVYIFQPCLSNGNYANKSANCWANRFCSLISIQSAPIVSISLMYDF